MMLHHGVTWDIVGSPDQECRGVDTKMSREEQPGNTLKGWWVALLLSEWFLTLLIFIGWTGSKGGCQHREGHCV